MPSHLPNWQRLLQQMQQCKTVAELVAHHGEAHHKVPQDGHEIWHYPLGVEKGMLYSIHVAIWPEGPRQAYLFFEPTVLPESRPTIPDWQRPAGIFALLGAAAIAYLAIYVPLRNPVSQRLTAGAPIFSVGIPTLLYIGTVLTFFGTKAARILGIGERESRVQLIVVVILTVLGLLLWMWIANIISHHGQSASYPCPSVFIRG
jgi:hypothetical protein